MKLQTKITKETFYVRSCKIQTTKSFTMNILGELMKALLPMWSGFGTLIAVASLSISVMGLFIGMLVGNNFKFNLFSQHH